MAIAAHTYRDKFFVLSLADGRHLVLGEGGELKGEERSFAAGWARAKLLFLFDERERLNEEIDSLTSSSVDAEPLPAE